MILPCGRALVHALGAAAKRTFAGGQQATARRSLKTLKDSGQIGNKVAVVNVGDDFGIELANAGRPLYRNVDVSDQALASARRLPPIC
jgi:hypothetical protein